MGLRAWRAASELLAALSESSRCRLMTWQEPQNWRSLVASKPCTLPANAAAIGKMPNPSNSQIFVTRTNGGRSTRNETRITAERAARPSARMAKGAVGKVTGTTPATLAQDLHQRRETMSCKTLARSPLRHAFVLAVIPLSNGPDAQADPLRLRADALAESQGTSSPTGLVVVQGQDSLKPWVDAEALVWAGAKPSGTGDVLVLAVRLREPHGYGELRAGRFVVATGAVRPVQIDGAYAIGRAPWGSTLETFGGLPVVPRFGPRAYDWIVGGRVAQRVGSAFALGLSYVERREDGDVSNQELGADVAAAPLRWLDVAAFGSYDVDNPGIAEARASAAARAADWRVELFASGAAQDVAHGLGGNGWVRGTLKLDDQDHGRLGLELRRVDVPGAEWTGIRTVASLPLGKHIRYSSELEIVVSDHPDGRGVAWPWGLSSLSWRSHDGWEVAAAVEASSSPLRRYETDALLRVSRALEIR